MLKTLLKKQITEIFRSYFFNPKTGKRRSGGALAAMLCCFGFLMIAVLGGMFALLSYVLCAPLHAAGLGVDVLCHDGAAVLCERGAGCGAVSMAL